MIPSIALMVGAYIITRMIQILIPEKEGTPSVIVLILAALTVAITLYCVVSVFTTGAEVSRLGF